MRPSGEREGGGHPPSRRPHRRGRRALAAASLVVLGGAWARLAVAGGERGTTREPPFRLVHPSLRSGGRDAVLYLSDRCRWCALEARNWSAALAPSASRAPLVVLSRDSDPRGADQLPAALRGRWLHDHDGSLARELGVGAVPFHARLAPGGWVTSVAAGLSRPDELRALLRHLSDEPLPREGHP